MEKVLGLQLCYNLSDSIVQCDRHRCVNLPWVIRNVADSVHISLRRLVIWLMDGIICQVEKERLCRMAIDKGDCLLSEKISQIAGFLHQPAVFPNKTIIVGLLGIEEAIKLIKASLGRKQVGRE